MKNKIKVHTVVVYLCLPEQIKTLSVWAACVGRTQQWVSVTGITTEGPDLLITLDNWEMWFFLSNLHVISYKSCCPLVTGPLGLFSYNDLRQWALDWSCPVSFYWFSIYVQSCHNVEMKMCTCLLLGILWTLKWMDLITYQEIF